MAKIKLLNVLREDDNIKQQKGKFSNELFSFNQTLENITHKDSFGNSYSFKFFDTLNGKYTTYTSVISITYDFVGGQIPTTLLYEPVKYYTEKLYEKFTAEELSLFNIVLKLYVVHPFVRGTKLYESTQNDLGTMFDRITSDNREISLNDPNFSLDKLMYDESELPRFDLAQFDKMDNAKKKLEMVYNLYQKGVETYNYGNEVKKAYYELSNPRFVIEPIIVTTNYSDVVPVFFINKIYCDIRLEGPIGFAGTFRNDVIVKVINKFKKFKIQLLHNLIK